MLNIAVLQQRHKILLQEGCAHGADLLSRGLRFVDSS